MPISEIITMLILREALGEELNKQERKALYNYRYRTENKLGRKIRLESQRLYKDKYRSFTISLTKVQCTELERLIQPPITGTKISKLIKKLLKHEIIISKG
jgi:hypothetical protein